MIVIVFGLPGSGKSFFASRLAAELKAEYLSSDRIRSAMLKKATYTEEEKERVYDEVLNRTLDALERHDAVVIDATFYRRALRDKFIEALKGRGSIFFIEVFAREAIILERLRSPREFSDADEGVYRKVKTQWEPMKEHHLLLESKEDNIEVMVGKAKRYLRGER